MRPLARLALLIAAGVALPLRTAAPAPDGGVELDGPILVEPDDGTLLLVRVVDRWTGRGVAGAIATLHDEQIHPTPGIWRALGSAAAEDDGWIRMPRSAVPSGRDPGWVYLEADGHAPTSLFEPGPSPRVVELDRPVDVPLEFRDPLDRPLGAIEVEWLLGCGHTPDLRRAVTDAGGRAVLRGIETGGHGQVWFRGEHVRSEYVDVAGWRPGDGTVIHRCRWARPVVGTVLSADGKPAVGVAVGHPQCHRGPWVRTDANGRFRLLATELGAGDVVRVEAFDAPVRGKVAGPRTDFVVPPLGFEGVVRLPKEDAEDEPAPALAVIPVEVSMPGEAGWVAEVCAVRKGDGLTFSASVHAGEPRAELEVPPGAYAVLAWTTAVVVVSGGTAPGGWWREPGLTATRSEVVVTPAPATAVRLVLPPPRGLTVSWSGPADATLAVVTEESEVELPRPDRGSTSRVAVPRSDPVFLRVTHRDVVRVVLVPASALAPDAPPFVPPWPREVRVRARLVDPDGRPVDGKLRVLRGERATETEEAAAALEVSVAPGEDRVAELWSHPDGLDLVRRALPSPLPEGGDVDLGEVRLPRVPAPRLSVVDVEGSPVDRAAVRLVQGEQRLDVETGADGLLRLSASDDAALREGALVAVERSWAEPRKDPVLPHAARLEGPGPWRLRPPAGRIEVRAADAEGRPLESFVVLVDGLPVLGEQGFARARGVAPGLHEVVVTAVGRRARRFAPSIGGDETLRLETHLRAAAGPR